MLLLALALAAQPMGQPGSIDGGHVVIGPTRAFADQERAALACVATNGVWRCDPELLRAFNAEDTTTIDAPAGVSVSVKLVVGPRQNTGASAGSSQRCVTAVHVDVTATPEPVVVDWGGATLTVDGENVSVAGDAPLGGLTADLEPAAHGCLAADDARTRKLTLEVPLRVGDATGRLRVDATRRVLSVDEKTALALVNAPQEMPPPDHKQPPFPTESAAIGAGIGAAIGALALGGLVFAASLRVYNTSVSNGDYLIPVVNGGIGLVPGCCAGFTAGGFVGLAVGLAKDDAAHGDTSTHKPPREASAGGYAAVASSKPPATTARAPEKRTNHSRRASADPGPTERTVVPPS